MDKQTNYLLRRFFKEKYSRKDYLELKELVLTKKPELKEAMKDHWDEFANGKLSESKNLSHLRKSFNLHLLKENRKKSLHKYLKLYSRIAAILVIPLMIALGLLYNQFANYLTQEDVLVEVTSPIGSRTFLNLPDGSSVWLNGDSHIRYPAIFKGKREVEVKGEAFFEVTSDKENPFLVEAKGIVVRATGTEFNVLAYDDEPEVSVILKEGKVAVLKADHTFLQNMESGFNLIYNESKSDLIYENINVADYTSWTKGKLVFRNATFWDVINRMHRWYGVDFEIENKELLALHFKATFIDESIEEALKLLQSTATFNYTIEKKKSEIEEGFERTKIIITK